jgi:hypothetical protein
MKNIRRLLVVTISLIFLIIDVGAASAALPQSYVYPNGKTYATEKVEFDRLKLAVSKSSNGAMWQSLNTIMAGQLPDSFKYSNKYYNRLALGVQYGNLTGANKTLDNAIAATTPKPILTRFANESAANFTPLVFEGPTTISASTSMVIVRATDTKTWNATETTTVANQSNSIGTVKFIFPRALDKTSADNVTILINGAAPAAEDQTLIKEALFGEFVTRATDSNANVLDGDIAMSYSTLKAALSAYNNDVAVTSVTLTVKYLDATTDYMTININ